MNLGSSVAYVIHECLVLVFTECVQAAPQDVVLTSVCKAVHVVQSLLTHSCYAQIELT